MALVGWESDAGVEILKMTALINQALTPELNLEGALDAVDALDAANVGENGFELALVGDFEAGFDAGVLLVWPAFEHANI